MNKSYTIIGTENLYKSPDSRCYTVMGNSFKDEDFLTLSEFFTYYAGYLVKGIELDTPNVSVSISIDITEID